LLGPDPFDDHRLGNLHGTDYPDRTAPMRTEPGAGELSLPETWGILDAKAGEDTLVTGIWSRKST
jgi:hypothetical protein